MGTAFHYILPDFVPPRVQQVAPSCISRDSFFHLGCGAGLRAGVVGFFWAASECRVWVMGIKVRYFKNNELNKELS